MYAHTNTRKNYRPVSQVSEIERKPRRHSTEGIVRHCHQYAQRQDTDGHSITNSIAAILAIKLLDGSVVLVGSAKTFDWSFSQRGRIYQANATAFISAVLLLTRMITAACATLVIWRSLFAILHSGGTSLVALNRLASYGIPPIKHLPPLVLTLVWLCFILVIPAQFAAPLATGAVAWLPITEYSVPASTTSIEVAGPTIWWQWFNNASSSINRQYAAYEASSQAGVTFSSAFQDDTQHTTLRRPVASIPPLPLGALLTNITLPYFRIHSLDWWLGPGEPANMAMQAITNSSLDTLSISGQENTLMGPTRIGQPSLVAEAAWQPFTGSGTCPWPKAKLLTTIQWIVVVVGRHDSTYEFTDCGSSPQFGPLPAGLYTIRTKCNCYAFARVNFTAGAKICSKCPVVAEGIVGERTNDSQSPQVVPDPLTMTALAMIPDVLMYTTIMNLTRAPTWQNLDTYTRGSITIAYQASWIALMHEFETATAETTISIPLTFLRAQVDQGKILAWLGLNAGVLLAGILLAVLQSHTRQKPVRDLVIAALLADSRMVLERDWTGLCNASHVTSKDKKAGKLRFVNVEGKDGDRWHHPVLDLE